jgi:predicted anti-sigma-YlaC factor YlaD
MRCEQVRIELSDGLGRKTVSYPDSVRQHLETCPECADYLRQLSLLRNTLDRPDPRVLPGELDEITFENIIQSAGVSKRAIPGRSRAWRLGWVFAPLALVAVIAAVISFSNFEGNRSGVYVAETDGPITEQELIGQIAENDTLPDIVISSMAGDDKYLDSAVEEMIGQAGVDQILDSMSDDELQALYSRIDELKG